MLTIICKGCGKVLRIPEQYLGRWGTCKHCGNKIHAVPSSDAPQKPAIEKQPPKNRFIVIDGTNLMWVGGDKPDISVVLAVAGYLLSNKMDFICYFDASTPHLLKKNPQCRPTYTQLLHHKHYFIEVTGGIQADDVIIDEAKGHDDAIIISNDQYRDSGARGACDRKWLKERSVKVVLSRDRIRAYGPLKFETPLPNEMQVNLTFAMLTAVTSRRTARH